MKQLTFLPSFTIAFVKGLVRTLRKSGGFWFPDVSPRDATMAAVIVSRNPVALSTMTMMITVSQLNMSCTVAQAKALGIVAC